MTKAEIYELAKSYIVAGFHNPNTDYKITDTIQTLTQSKQDYFWELVDIAFFTKQNHEIITTSRY